MMNSVPDFSKIWAINGKKYQFTDEQYLAGWGFIGSIPPARQQFDALQYTTDEKLLWLFEKCEQELTVISSKTEPETQREGGIWLEVQGAGTGGSEGGGGDTPLATGMVVSDEPPTKTAAVWGDLANNGVGKQASDGGDLQIEMEISSVPPLDKNKLWGFLRPEEKES